MIEYFKSYFPAVAETTTFSSVSERKPLSEAFTFQQTVMETIASMPESTKKKMGYQPSEFVVSCEYEGSTCNTE